MKNKILKLQIISFIVETILGTILHFTYEWSGNNQLIGLFSAINESTWEHLKLIFYPMLLMTIIGYFYIGGKQKNYLCSKVIGIIFAMIFTIVVFYTYTGVLGKNIGWINILIYFLAVALGEFIAYWRMIKNKNNCNELLALIIIILFIIFFSIFTFSAPQIGIFKNPI